MAGPTFQPYQGTKRPSWADENKSLFPTTPGIFKGEVVLGDEFSPDGCRLWDQETLEKLDKDRFRQDLGGVVEAYESVATRLGVPDYFPA